MTVEINSCPTELPCDEPTLSDALRFAKIEQQGIATAVNGKVVSATDRDTVRLNDGDKILVIKAFCGG